ncbi:MAG TPA: NAD-dependent epimerase/dehydratase family protein [Myxococcales bacterium]|nr:NAD-dependent epimerase/dehydratase family protein [Myxococcales bacterium]
MGTTLITGIVGSLARLTARRLINEGISVVGVDYRPKPRDFPSDIPFIQASYNKTRIEDAFRRFQPDTVLHLGRVGNLKMHLNKRFDLNVIGSAKVMELCIKYKVTRTIILSTFHIYGAHPHNHIPIFEDEPLRAAQTFPQLADALQLDTQAVTWAYKHRKIRVAVLRPCNVIGPDIRNAISRYLRFKRVAYVAGYSPMWQFIHQDDMVEALYLTHESRKIGVYNVAGKGAVPLLDALDLTNASQIPIPSPLATLYLTIGSQLMSTFPPYLLDFFRYPCVISDEKFKKDFKFTPQISIRNSILSCMNENR